MSLVYLPRSVLSLDLRARVEQTVEWRVALVDAVETPSEDLEPSLGTPEQHTASIFFQDGTWHTLPAGQTRWAAGGTEEREGDLADAADDHEGGDVLDDGEETLGWCENVSQRTLGPNTADGDNTAPERHGRGFVRCGQDDYEPSFGASNPQMAGGGPYGGLQPVHQIECGQIGWGVGSSDDREHDEAERGIADADGCVEQLGWFHGMEVR